MSISRLFKALRNIDVVKRILVENSCPNGEVATWEELGIREEVEAAIKKARGEVDWGRAGEA